MSEWRLFKHFCSGLPQYGLNVPSSGYADSGTRLIRTSDVNDRGELTGVDPVFVEDSIVGSNYRLIDGDLLLSRSGTLGRCHRYQLSEGNATFAGYLIRFRPNDGSDPRFLEYCARSRFFQQAIEAEAPSSTISNFNAERYGNLRIPWWPPEQQRAIADYLDIETGRIDVLISKKRHMIDFLTERRQALITSALTGDMVNRVATIPLKHLVQINERVLPETTDPGREIRYVDIGSVGRGRLVKQPKRMRFADAPSRARRLVSPGDTIVSTVRTYLRAVWPVGGDIADLVVSTGFAVLTPTGIDPGYLSWWVLSDTFIEEVVARSVGVSYPAISALELGDLHVHLPALAEQRAIADHLDVEAGRIDSIISKTHRTIELFAKRRQALITAAVAGQLAIPGVAA